MIRIAKNLAAAAALCGATVLLPATGHAYDVDGVAVGADAAIGGPSGLALSIGLGRLELDFIAGVGLVLPEAGVLEPSLAAAGGLFVTLADGETTNLQLGGRVGVLVVSTSGAGFGATLDTNAGLTLEADLRVEHRLDDHCAINLQVGIAGQIWPDGTVGTPMPDFVLGFGQTGFVGGAGFRYWFDGLGGAAPLPVEAAPQPARAPARAAPPASPPEGGEQPPAGETPYWEQ